MNWQKVLIVVGVAFSLVLMWFSQLEHSMYNRLDVLRDAVQIIFAREVGGITIDSFYREKLVYQTEDFIQKSRMFNSSQFFLLVDRNHAVQKAFFAFYNLSERKVIIVGSDKISTGNPKRIGHFETPVGVFENSPTNMSYRALGTKNKLNWRALGAKGSRIWDFGWQRTMKGHGEPMDIRLLVHATDPDLGERRLGTIQSMGCVRITSRLNKFLDHYGVLDQEYEENTKTKYVLLTKRSPIPFAGKFVVIIDSSAG